MMIKRLLVGAAVATLVVIAVPSAASAAQIREDLASPATATASDCGAAIVSNWAGNIDCGHRGKFTAAEVQFSVPRFSSGPGAGAGFWVGLGGGAYTTGSRMLVQAGVGDLYGADPYAWWEVIGDNGYNDGPVTVCPHVHVGDAMTVVVSSNYNGDGYNYASIKDDTHPGSCSFASQLGHTPLSDSATAECIVEAHGDALANFGSVEFTHCLAAKNNSAFRGVGTFTHYYSNIGIRSVCQSTSVGAIKVDGGFQDQYSVFYKRPC